MGSNHQGVAVFGHCGETSVCSVAKEYPSHEFLVGYYNSGDRVRYWGSFGAYWGGLWGLLFGSGLFLVPGIGTAVVGGGLVAFIVGSLESVAIGGGLSALGAGLCGLGIGKHSILDYEADIRAGKFLLIAPRAVDEAVRARASVHQGL